MAADACQSGLCLLQALSGLNVCVCDSTPWLLLPDKKGTFKVPRTTLGANSNSAASKTTCSCGSTYVCIYSKEVYIDHITSAQPTRGLMDTPMALFILSENHLSRRNCQLTCLIAREYIGRMMVSLLIDESDGIYKVLVVEHFLQT